MHLWSMIPFVWRSLLTRVPGPPRGGVLIGLRYGHNCMASAAGRGTRGAGIAERMGDIPDEEGVS